jgi:hypothetical protein
MSEWGSVQVGGQARTAWEYRIDFQQLGSMHDQFYCPFCNITLTPMLIFRDEVSRSPHFSARSISGHLFDCDGYPIFAVNTSANPPVSHYQKRMAHFPEALTLRPPVRAKQSPAQKPLGAPLTSDEVVRRQKQVGSLGKPIIKSYILRSIVEVYSLVLEEGFDLAKIKKWNDAAKWQWIKAALSSMKLCLSKETNYSDGFRSPSLIDLIDPKIYHNEGSIKIEGFNFIVTSKLLGKTGQTKIPFFISASAVGPPVGAPKSHQALIDTLKAMVATGNPIRWYAYGLPERTSDAFVLRVTNLDYFDVEPTRKPK